MTLFNENLLNPLPCAFSRRYLRSLSPLFLSGKRPKDESRRTFDLSFYVTMREFVLNLRTPRRGKSAMKLIAPSRAILWHLISEFSYVSVTTYLVRIDDTVFQDGRSFRVKLRCATAFGEF